MLSTGRFFFFSEVENAMRTEAWIEGNVRCLRSVAESLVICERRRALADA
jgi:DNA-binding NtrC family response regulator